MSENNMQKISSNLFKYVAVFICGIAIGLVFVFMNNHKKHNHTESTISDKSEPLYWVAPMDPNFIRDEPGLSPMGMDLVPVYAEDVPESVGTVSINSQIINNIGVRTSRAIKRVLSDTVNTVGYVTYDEDKLIHMHPRVEGWVEKLYIKASGDPIVKGEPVYSLYSPQLVAAQEELLIAVNRNNRRLINAAEERLRALHLSNEFIQRIKSTKAIENTVVFYAPQSGIIDNLNIREGFFVKPGLTLLSIANLDSVWVEAELFERQSDAAKSDLPVTMTVDYQPEYTWQGKVDYVYPVLSEKMRTIRVRLKFDNPEHVLKPNMFASVAILTQATQELLSVPVEAVIRTGQQNRVVIANESGEFKSVAVQLGKITDQYAEIISGVFEGEKVVTSAQFLLDSESSKTSDFRRLDSDVERKPSVATTHGEVLDLNPENNTVTIHHNAIKHWRWPAATIDFNLEPPFSTQNFTRGDTLDFKFALSGGEYFLLSVINKTPSKVIEPSIKNTSGLMDESEPMHSESHANHQDMENKKVGGQQ
ncbi:efflux RND transporter periplasmic adaptor subunit [Sessilibacter corallicola]|uniref:Efflux RND transporter periplasmic adaptor subunit n=2 Tax=Sessilibacter corallicola TaxID=2904075 RepID=A0ABQ0AA77_9GAMM